MSDHKRRISALKAIVAGSPGLAGAAIYAKVIDEFEEVIRVRRLEPRRRCRLLQILHSTRALDSTLAAFLDHYGHRGTSNSLGGYLHALSQLTPGKTPNKLSDRARLRFQKNIVDDRNRYMHGSGEYPLDDTEIRKLLAEMQDCLATILAL
jgi:hypothetical protein